MAGLWKDSLFDDLFWAHREICQSNGVMKARPSRPHGYRAPSWSWASVDGGVRWLYANDNRTGEYYAELLDHDIKSRTDESFGEVKAAYVTIKAPLWKIPDDLKHALLVEGSQADYRHSDLDSRLQN